MDTSIKTFLNYKIKKYFADITAPSRKDATYSKHEVIKGLLFQLAFIDNYTPLPEYMPKINNRKQRIDIVWSSGGLISKAFEIDRTIYPKSIKKLLSLPDYTEKWIVSIGKYNSRCDVGLLFGTSIKRINLTDEFLRRDLK